MKAALLRGGIIAAAMALAEVFSLPARADAACAAKCNTLHDQCMATSHDSLSCDSARNECLRACGGYH